MPKGFFTQSAAILLKESVPLDVIRGVLQGTSQQSIPANSQETQWMGGPVRLVLPLTPSDGAVAIEVFNEPWPDGMGHPNDDPGLFAAWTMGFFGPCVYPGALERAVQQAWGLREADRLVKEHRAFVRILTTYAFGKGPDAPLLPDKYDPLAELQRVTEIALNLLTLPAALVYFNPNGEALHTLESMRSSYDYHRANNLPPLDIWSNIRLLNPGNGWMVMDTVGMEQLDVFDHEACFPAKKYGNNNVANFLRNATDYIRQKGPVIKHGDTMNGPENIRWQALHAAESLWLRPRPTLRWFPLDGTRAPEDMLPKPPDPSPAKQ